MNPEEEKIENVNILDDEDDFTDSVVIAPKPVEEEPKPEEEAPQAPAEEEPEVVEEPEEPLEPVVEAEDAYTTDYDDPRLEAIEGARITWNKSYKKMARIRFFVSVLILLTILAGWLVPTLTMQNQGATPLLIAIGIAVVAIVALVIFSVFQKRYDKEGLNRYFAVYYDSINSYTLGDYGATNITGTPEDKITPAEFMEGGVFDEVTTVGSRDAIVFQYKGMDCALTEAAGQVDAGKALQTIFVGKYLRTHNTADVSDEGLVIYFKGNDRALPPKKLESLHVLEKNGRYKVYGNAKDKRVLTKKVREGLAKIRTNKLLVDVCLVIKPGRTYWYLGYEDDIMILPGEKVFDARYNKAYKEQLLWFLDVSLMLNQD